MITEPVKRNLQYSIIYFSLSTVITSWFIAVAPVYNDLNQQLLSCAIAGAKWFIQIIAALIFLEDKKWTFIKNIGFTCLLGSFILLPYSLCNTLKIESSSVFFFVSLIVSVAIMIVSYLISVKKSEVGSHWWAAWLFCLVVAITLQLKVVFNLNIFQE